MMHAREESTLVGSSNALAEVRELLQRFAPTPLPVIIEGETGVGKELAARELHRLSGRLGNLVAVNCAAVPETMVEAELFGFVRGAFTGAIRDYTGLIVQAHKGTLFLDEIATLPLVGQAKLLRVLEDRTVRHIGGTASRPVDFRAVVASNEPLDNLLASGRFRADLRHRLAGAFVRIPPLRERPDDIPEIAAHLLSGESDKSAHPRSLDATAIDALVAYHWPGNVRELKQVLHRAVALSPTPRLTADCVKRSLSHVAPRSPLRLPPAIESERNTLLRLLEEERWRIPRVSARLGVTPKTVYARIVRHGITIPMKHHRRDVSDTRQAATFDVDR